MFSKWWLGASCGLATCMAWLALVGGAAAETPPPPPPPTIGVSGSIPAPPQIGSTHPGGPVKHETVYPHGTPTGQGDIVIEHHGPIADHGGHGESPSHKLFDAGGVHSVEDTGLFVNVSWLLMRPRRRALDYAILDPTTPLTNGLVDGNVLSLNYHTASGYRIGAGYGLANGWEAGATYTYFHSRDNQAPTAPAGGTLIATLTAPGIDLVNVAIASANVDIDVIDLELAKRLKVTEDLLLKISFGPRYASITQKLDVFYAGQTAGLGFTRVSSPVGFDGFGVRVGTEAGYDVGCNGLRLFASAHLSLLSGDFRATLAQGTNAGAVRLNVRDKYEALVPVLELALGVAYNLNDNINISLGYELSNWFNMVDSLNFNDSFSFGKIGRRMSDLTLEGLAFKIGLNY